MTKSFYLILSKVFKMFQKDKYMPRRLKPELKEIILGLYEPSSRNALKVSKMLREQGYSVSQSTVMRIWNAADYKLRDSGERGKTQSRKIKATSCS